MMKSNKRILVTIKKGMVERILTTENDIEVFVEDKDTLPEEFNSDFQISHHNVVVVTLETFDRITTNLIIPK